MLPPRITQRAAGGEPVACCADGSCCARSRARPGSACFCSRRCCASFLLALASACLGLALLLVTIAPDGSAWLRLSSVPVVPTGDKPSETWTRYRLAGGTDSFVCGEAPGSGTRPPLSAGCQNEPPWYVPLPVTTLAGAGAADTSRGVRLAVIVAAALITLAFALATFVLLPLSTLCCRAGASNCGTGCAGSGPPACSAGRYAGRALLLMRVCLAATAGSAVLLFVAAGVYDDLITMPAVRYASATWGKPTSSSSATAATELSVRVTQAEGYNLAIAAGVFVLVFALPSLFCASNLGVGWLYPSSSASGGGFRALRAGEGEAEDAEAEDPVHQLELQQQRLQLHEQAAALEQQQAALRQLQLQLEQSLAQQQAPPAQALALKLDALAPMATTSGAASVASSASSSSFFAPPTSGTYAPLLTGQGVDL